MQGKQAGDFKSSAGYCSITAMSVVNKRSKCVLDMYDDHVKIKKSDANLTAGVDFSKLTNEEKIQF